MTTAIEVTKREMYEKLKAFRCYAVTLETLEESFEAHLEALRQDRAALVTERDTLRNRVQVLEMANQTSGEVIRGLKEEARQARKNFMAARLAEVAASVSVPPYNASGAVLDGNTATILGALVDAQRIMTDYLVPDGIRAKDAMGKLTPVLDNETLCLAMDAFEKPKEEITGASLSAKYFSGRTIASVAIDKMVKDAMRHGTGWIRMTSSEDGVEITNLPADEIIKKPGCQHSFHQCYGPRETCTFCGVGK